jgi:predicted transcriptional regulator of viral defense system
MRTLKDYLKYLQANGRYSFTIHEASTMLKISYDALRSSIYKLRKKGEVATPAKGFFIIIPPEHQSIGCLPAEELIPILMKYLNLDYYTCLLTAALYHGASHQKPQIFQVMVNKQLKPIVCGNIKIEFIYKKNWDTLPTQNRTVKSGYLKIATPEVTAMDLLLYPHRAGNLNHIATVLSELLEAINIDELLKIISASKQKAWIQRLGYMLEKLDPVEVEKCDELVKALKKHLKKQSLTFIPLNPDLPKKGKNRNRDWMIIENTTIESDE